MDKGSVSRCYKILSEWFHSKMNLSEVTQKMLTYFILTQRCNIYYFSYETRNGT